MSNRVVSWLTGLVVVCMVILLLLNSIPLFWSPDTEKYLKYNDVRGMAVEYKNKIYTLNFDQQKELIGYLNQSIPVGLLKNNNGSPKTEISKIVIYRFGLPDLTLIPIEYSNHRLIFSAPEWNPDGWMKDVSSGALENLLSKTHD